MSSHSVDPLLGEKVKTVEAITTQKSTISTSTGPKKVNTCCLQKINPDLSSKWVIIGMIVLGIVGITAAGAGAVGFFAQQHMLPAALAKLNILGAVGHAGSIAIMAGGGVLTLVAVGFLIASVRKTCDKKRKAKLEQQKIEQEKILAVETKEKERKQLLDKLFQKLEVNRYTYITNEDGTKTFIGKREPEVEEGEPGRVLKENVAAKDIVKTNSVDFKDFVYQSSSGLLEG